MTPAAVLGLDPDPNALGHARRKAEQRGLAVGLDRGFSDALQYTESSFARVFSAFMLYYLALEEKERTLREVRRVLRRDGVFHALDFGKG